MVEQELRTLEAFRQGFAHGLLDDARAGETDQRLGLADVDVAEHARLADTPPVVGLVSTLM